MDGLDPDDRRPGWQQVRDRLRAAIKIGELGPGDRLPTHKALADEYGLAMETVKRALNELRAEGLIVTRQGKGTYVRAEPRRDAERTDSPAVADIQAQVVALTKRLDEVERRLNDR
ncbi:GntR family transcriptional regulator [Pseudonocardia sp. Cha107L01]|uniref:GntR family transcriptional regulator n=1 Tax=Pseudonocardia sp. Cha107L01 TaxID=3457576 RepID=UPI00403EB9F5